jgi:CRP-like cAMP-binding protein
MAHEDVLASVPLFSHLKRGDLTRLGKAVVPRKHAAGEMVVKEGDQAAGFFIITKGRVEVVKSLKGEKPQQLAVLGPGEFFGEMALLDGYLRSTSVRALEDAEFLVLTRWDFMAELQESPHMALSLLAVLSRRLRETEARLAD